MRGGVPLKSWESFSVCGETFKFLCASSTEAPCLLEEVLTAREVSFQHVQLEHVF